MDTLALLDISKVCWSHDAVYDHFKDGRSIFETVVQLLSREVKLEDLPPLQLVKRGKDVYSLSNRRLFALKKYAAILKSFGQLHEKSNFRVPVSFCELTSGDAFTTKNGGLEVDLERPLKHPTFAHHKSGPCQAPSTRSLSRDASRERRPTSVGRWSGTQAAPPRGRRTTFGQVDYRFVLTEDSEAALVPPRGRRTPSPLVCQPSNVQPSPAGSDNKTVSGYPNTFDNDLPITSATGTKLQQRPERLRDDVRETRGTPQISKRRTSKEEDVADLLVRWICLQREIPGWQALTPKCVQKLLAQLAPNTGEEGEIEKWKSGLVGSSLGPQSQVEKLLMPLRQSVSLLELQVEEMAEMAKSSQVGALQSQPQKPGELGAQPSCEEGSPQVLEALSPDGSLMAKLLHLPDTDGTVLLLVDPIADRILYRHERLPVAFHDIDKVEFSETEYALCISGHGVLYSFNLESKVLLVSVED